jgi:hypothetical protein
MNCCPDGGGLASAENAKVADTRQALSDAEPHLRLCDER